MNYADERRNVCEIARSYVRTPYHDCGMVKGAGVDCATLLAMVYAEAGAAEVEVRPYSPQWYLHNDGELYVGHVLEVADEIEQADAQPGDIVIYKFGRAFAHGAIIVEPGFPTIVHAFKQARMVIVGEGDQGDLADRPRRFFRLKRWRV